MDPVIGITAGVSSNEFGQPVISLNQAYLRAVSDAGGIPVVVPSTSDSMQREAVYARLDALLFSGGGDIAPGRYGGEPHPRVVDVDRDRDDLELDFVARAVEDGKPFLAICRGFQVLNVGLGGTLFTHVPDQVPGALRHDNPADKRHYLAHEIQLLQDSQLAEIMGTTQLRVNSHHHQGARQIGARLRVIGTSPDGLVEAIELPSHPFGFGVQWHPEWLTDMQPTRQLFQRFVEAARTRG